MMKTGEEVICYMDRSDPAWSFQKFLSLPLKPVIDFDVALKPRLDISARQNLTFVTSFQFLVGLAWHYLSRMLKVLIDRDLLQIEIGLLANIVALNYLHELTSKGCSRSSVIFWLIRCFVKVQIFLPNGPLWTILLCTSIHAPRTCDFWFSLSLLTYHPSPSFVVSMCAMGIISTGISSLVYRYLQSNQPTTFRGENVLELPAILAYYSMYHKSNSFAPNILGNTKKKVRTRAFSFEKQSKSSKE